MSHKPKTTGYIASDTEDRRIIKARCFVKSMVSKGQSKDNAIRIAAKYYHIKVEDLEYHNDDDDDDIYFFCGSAIPIAASEIFDPGDFC